MAVLVFFFIVHSFFLSELDMQLWLLGLYITTNGAGGLSQQMIKEANPPCFFCQH